MEIKFSSYANLNDNVSHCVWHVVVCVLYDSVADSHDGTMMMSIFVGRMMCDDDGMTAAMAHHLHNYSLHYCQHYCHHCHLLWNVVFVNCNNRHLFGFCMYLKTQMQVIYREYMKPKNKMVIEPKTRIISMKKRKKIKTKW